MPTCPNCGSIVMEGDPYCPHCGAHFRWSFDDEEEWENPYGEPARHDFHESQTDFGKHAGFLDFGEVSHTYLEADEEALDYIAGHICANHAQKMQLETQIREYQNAPDFKGFYIRKDYGFEVYYFHFIQENEYVRTTHVMTYRQDSEFCRTPYSTFYDSYSEHNHDRLLANPRFKKLIEGTCLEFVGCGGGYETDFESVSDVTLTGEISIHVIFRADGRKRMYDLDLNAMKLSRDYYEYE